jgi:hypothetical protein
MRAVVYQTISMAPVALEGLNGCKVVELLSTCCKAGFAPLHITYLRTAISHGTPIAAGTLC